MVITININKAVNATLDIAMYFTAFMVVVQKCCVYTAVWFNIKFPFMAVNVPKEVHWFFGTTNGAAHKIVLTGAVIAVFYKFIMFCIRSYKKFKKKPPTGEEGGEQ